MSSSPTNTRLDWDAMTVDEYANYERTVNGQVSKSVGGVWWYPVRPLFYRPLFLFESLPENVSIPLAGALIGGVQYPVSSGSFSNSRLNLLACDAVHSYSLSNMECSLRSQIRKGLRTFQYREITDPKILADQGHPAYLEFLERTHYGHNNSRQDPAEFSRWAHAIFQCPKVKAIGAFHDNRLAAVCISFLVRDILHYKVYFGNQFALANRASDGMLHTIRESAVGDSRIHVTFSAFAGMPRGLDKFYIRRGFKILSRPARFRGNPVVITALKYLAADRYRKLVGGASRGSNGCGSGKRPHVLHLTR